MTEFFILHTEKIGVVMRCCRFLMALIVTLLLAVPVQSALIIEVQDAQLSAGGTGFVDIYVRSTNSDLINIFNLELSITGFHPSGALHFSSVQSSTVQQATNPDYIFLNATDVNNFGYARQDPDLTILIGGDQRTGGTDTTLTSTNLLLARLAIEHQTPTPLSSSGVYQLSVVNAGSFFADSSFNFADIQSSTPGTITITAVPEPSSFAVLGAFAVIGMRSWRRRCLF